MMYVRAGVRGFSAERKKNGFVVSSKPDSLEAAWAGEDDETGIRNFLVSIGTQPGMMMPAIECRIFMFAYMYSTLEFIEQG